MKNGYSKQILILRNDLAHIDSVIAYYYAFM